MSTLKSLQITFSELRIANIRLNVLPVFLASNASNKKIKRGRECLWYKFPIFCVYLRIYKDLKK